MKLRIADGSTRTIEGCGDINFVFRSGNGIVRVLLTNVAYVPDLRYHLFPLPTLVENGHTFEGRPAGIVVMLKSERSIVFPLTGKLYSLYGYHIDYSPMEDACSVLATGKLPNKPVGNIRLPLRDRTLPRGTTLQGRGEPRDRSRGKTAAKGAPWRRVSANVTSSPRTHSSK